MGTIYPARHGLRAPTPSGRKLIEQADDLKDTLNLCRSGYQPELTPVLRAQFSGERNRMYAS
jgi:hypothetical protein